MYNRLARVSLLVLVIAVLTIAPLASAQGGPQALGLRPDAPPYARHGPYWVGVQQFEAEAPTHATKVMVWYPALNPEGTEEIATFHGDYDPAMGTWPITYHSLQDAAPDPSGGPYPLVIYVHGLNAQRHSGKWLGDHLATYGFVVIAIDQLDNMGTANDTTVFPDAWAARPQDVSWQIDLAGSLTAGGGILEGSIDTDRVAVIGHSFGGYTTLVAGGARLDWAYYRTWCGQNRERTVSPGLGGGYLCDMMNVQAALAPLFGQDAAQAGLWPSMGDPRVDVIVPMAPVYWPLFGPEGMGSVTVPLLLMGGTADTVLTPPDWEPFYTNAASQEKALVLFEHADHMLFLYGCDDAPWYVDSGLFGFCSDPVWDMDRAHDLANHFVTAFLLATLEGDAVAAAALSPDAVRFPGITYEATGF